MNIQWQDLWPLITFLIAVQFSPGPNNLFFFTAGASRQFTTAYRLLFAIVCSLGILQFSFAFGIGKALQSVPALTTILKLCSSGFLIYLGWKLWISPPAKKAKILSPWQGAAFQFINPKILGIVTTTYHFLPNLAATQKTVFLTLLVMSLCSLSGLLWIMLGIWVERWLRTARSRQIFNRISATSLFLLVPMLW